MIAAVALPISRLARWPEKNRPEVRWIADIAFCAATTPLKSGHLPSQMSQLPQGCEVLGESGEQGLAPAARRLAEGEQRVELAPLHALSLGRRVAPLDLALAQHDVGVAEEGQRIGGQAIAAGAADLLVIGLDALRQVGMADEAHVLLVDAHAEGDGGDDDDAVLAQKLVLMRRSDLAARARRGKAARRRLSRAASR